MISKLRSDKKWLAIFIGVVILVLCLIGMAVFGANNTPEKVLNKYIAAVNARDYEKMYSLIREDDSMTKEDFIERNQNIYEGIDAQNMAIKEIRDIQEVDKKTQVIDYGFTMDTVAGNTEQWSRVSFKKDGFFDTYKIMWNSQVIFPELGDEDTIYVDTIAAKRGEILDRNGNILAGEGTASKIGLVPGKINKETREADLAKLAGLLGVTPEVIKTVLSQSWVTDETFVPIKTIASGNGELEGALLQIPGVLINEATLRVYPGGEKTSHLTGYVQGIGEEELQEKKAQGYTEASVIGKSGLERLYEKQLKGEDGATINIYRESAGVSAVLATKEAVPGTSIKTTIDLALQGTLYDQFAGDKSASVAMNPKTGEILALVSTPSYDANAFILGMSDEAWQALNSNPDNPLLTRYEASYAPGSSFKPVTGAAGLQSSAFTADEDFGTSGLSWQKDSSWGDFNVTTLTGYSGPANLENALIYSDNIYFAKAALKMGDKTFSEALKQMGFGETLPLDLEMTASQISESGTFDNEVQLAASGFGQGQILVNPLHLGLIYSAVVNDGNMVKPYLEYKDNPQVEYWKEGVFSKETAETLRSDLIQVVENPDGTGHAAQIDGLTLAGKTGTAEIKASQEDTKGTELGWFGAFTADPASEKQLLVMSMVEDVKDRGGSHYVVPKVKAAFQ